MEYLPVEIQLKILKYLKRKELFSFKLISRHFYNIINKYGDRLKRKTFREISFGVSNIVMPKTKVVDFQLSDELLEKWNSALERRIPIYLNAGSFPLHDFLVLNFYKKGDKYQSDYTLKLPLYPTNIEELKIIRWWLKQIFHCFYIFINFSYYVFNPEIIKILFYGDEITKPNLHCQMADLSYYNPSSDVWKFTFEHLIIETNLWIHFEFIDNTNKNDYILLKDLLNEGNKNLGVQTFQPKYDQITLYNLIMKHIETSKYYSNRVSNITFVCLKYNNYYHGNIKRYQFNVGNKYFNEENTLAYNKYYEFKYNPNSKYSVRWIYEDNDNIINNVLINFNQRVK